MSYPSIGHERKRNSVSLVSRSIGLNCLKTILLLFKTVDNPQCIIFSYDIFMLHHCSFYSSRKLFILQIQCFTLWKLNMPIPFSLFLQFPYGKWNQRIIAILDKWFYPGIEKRFWEYQTQSLTFGFFFPCMPQSSLENRNHLVLLSGSREN